MPKIAIIHTITVTFEALTLARLERRSRYISPTSEPNYWIQRPYPPPGRLTYWEAHPSGRLYVRVFAGSPRGYLVLATFLE